MSPLIDSLETIAQRASAAAPLWAATSPVHRARALVAIADALDKNAAQLVQIAQEETGLSEVRLSGELNRTAVQLRLFSEVVVDGSYLDVRIDEADSNFVLGVRADLRRYHVPLGPVLNFSASNFPFAFSVAGGDSASALAAGCPVIVKAHSGHPRLSRATATVVVDALRASGAPEGVFQSFAGQAEGVEMLKDPRVKAGSFTGSIRVGQLLAKVAASRAQPIPFYGELGSVNPVFVTAEAISRNRESIAEGFVASVSGSAGQLCTKPGFLFVPRASGLGETIEDRASRVSEHRLLNPGITRSYRDRRETILQTDGVSVVAVGSFREDDEGHGWATPTVVSVSVTDLIAQRERLEEEAFGPLSIMVEYDEGDDLAATAAELFEGNLTGTIHAGAGENTPSLQGLVSWLTRSSGRVLFGGWPTGVAVTPAMQHGGPSPATTNDSSTSVGSAAIGRFLRPVAYQDAPVELLPIPLRDDNPWNVPQQRSVAGESLRWGSAAALAD